MKQSRVWSNAFKEALKEKFYLENGVIGRVYGGKRGPKGEGVGTVTAYGPVVMVHGPNGESRSIKLIALATFLHTGKQHLITEPVDGNWFNLKEENLKYEGELSEDESIIMKARSEKNEGVRKMKMVELRKENEPREQKAKYVPPDFYALAVLQRELNEKTLTIHKKAKEVNKLHRWKGGIKTSMKWAQVQEFVAEYDAANGFEDYSVYKKIDPTWPKAKFDRIEAYLAGQWMAEGVLTLEEVNAKVYKYKRSEVPGSWDDLAPEAQAWLESELAALQPSVPSVPSMQPSVPLPNYVLMTEQVELQPSVQPIAQPGVMEGVVLPAELPPLRPY